MNNFSVLLKSDYVKDIYVSTNKDIMDISSLIQLQADIFLGVYTGNDEIEALNKASEEHKISTELLKTIPHTPADCLLKVEWYEEDVREIFQNHGIPINKKNMEIFMNKSPFRDAETVAVEEGNMALSDSAYLVMLDLEREATQQLIDIYWTEGTLEKEIFEEWLHFFKQNGVIGDLAIIFEIIEESKATNTEQSIITAVETIRKQLKKYEEEYYNQAEKIYNEQLAI